ncbi:hypothetical protein Airi01_095430 [Actinoallomurus iriomotensis]|uniref:Uncharacterized protein n=1 Tax=Actinoallomurus iriomotensis TaxID=478107 RepID=A0A9W6VWZ2_9ACTN|nr:hypothetical protein Airi01_095430 [Actinoallomurus iriomotensis]
MTETAPRLPGSTPFRGSQVADVTSSVRVMGRVMRRTSIQLGSLINITRTDLRIFHRQRDPSGVRDHGCEGDAPYGRVHSERSARR